MAFKIPDVEGLKTYLVTEVAERIRRRTPVDTGRARAGWVVNGDVISNDVPYIGYLEMGTPRMAPFGMVRTTMEEVPSIINEFLQKSRK